MSDRKDSDGEGLNKEGSEPLRMKLKIYTRYWLLGVLILLKCIT